MTTPVIIGNATLYLTGALQTPGTPTIPVAVFPVADGSWVEGNGTIAIRNPGGGSGGSQLTGTAAGDGYDTDNSPAGLSTTSKCGSSKMTSNPRFRRGRLRG